MKSFIAALLLASAALSNAHATVISTMNASSLGSFECLGTDSSVASRK